LNFILLRKEYDKFMSENKTKPTTISAQSFLHSVENSQKKKDCFEILHLMEEVTGKEPVMWGISIVGFDQYHYKYDSGREGDFLMVGFSPRKQNITIYIMPGFERFDQLMSKLGKFKTGKSCLYIKKLDDIDRSVLKTLVKESVDYMRKKYR
jgi:hypothetical protein